ncbi:unnamed protein product, partial [Arabidopsis halleri]
LHSFSSNLKKSVDHLFFNTYLYAKLTDMYEEKNTDVTRFDKLRQW